MAIPSLTTLTPNRAETIRNVLTWTAPAIAIPGLRYTQDTHERRKELFIRDASTYSIGALVFFGMEFITKQFLRIFPIVRTEASQKLMAFMAGLAANLLYAGIGAVKVSQAFARYQAQHSSAQNITPPTWPSIRPTTPMAFPDFRPAQRIQYFA